MHVLVDGLQGGQVDPLDRGLNYGDGLFETIAVLDGRPRFLDWHLERLAGGAGRLGFPALDAALLRREIAAITFGARCIVKLIVTRGSGPRGYRPPRPASTRRIVAAWDWPAPPASAAAGARVGWCRMRLGRNPALAGVKHLNRLEQVLARAEWDDGVMDEGLMCDEGGSVISATQANLFAKLAGRWVTPRLDQCGVAGVMRRAFCAWQAEQGSPVEERVLARADIESASALLLTNALAGAWPVRELEGRPVPVDGDCGEFSAWLARV
ncbi:MAG: aminodeoxychorismate lyase [Gammaproteobacteria bacterium]|nr:aminodeoxychorismate lyase [Gammaproteobacteria bacterium]